MSNGNVLKILKKMWGINKKYVLNRLNSDFTM
jgi:hypothetical protein